MKYFTKAVALLMVVLLMSTAFIGCSADEMSLYKAMMKSQDMTSIESKTDLTFRVDASGLSEKDAQAAQQVLATLNNLKLSFNQKSIMDQEKGLSKAQIDGTINMGGISMDLGIWVDSDLSNNKPVIKEIIKLPSIATAMMPPEFAGKPYIVLDLGKMTEQVPAANLDLQNVTGVSKNLQSTFTDFFNEYSKSFNPGFNLITSKGASGSNGKLISTYELKLDDATLKALVKYMVSDFTKNEVTRKLVKDFLIGYFTQLSSISPIYADAKANLETGFADMESSLPEFQKKFDQFMDAIKDVKVLGDNGITIRYLVDGQGYIVGETGSINVIIDSKAFQDAFAKVNVIEAEDNSPSTSGVIKLGIDFNTDVTSINKPVDLKFPELTAENSIDYFEMLNTMISNQMNMMEQDTGIKVYFNGKKVAFKDSPVLENDRVLVPAREIFESLGGVVNWDPQTQIVTSKVGDSTIIFNIGNASASVDDKPYTLDVPAKLINERAYVPLRFIVESLNSDIFWDDATSSAFIMK